MTQLTLTYFDIPRSRGEECRLALFIAGVPFKDERLTRPQWEERRSAAPYGALPILSMEGRPPLAQSNAILRMIGSQHGLLPSDGWESARHEALMCSVEEMRARVAPSGRLKDPEEKRKAREELATAFFPDWGRQIERQILGPFVGGTDISVADIKLFVALTPLLNGNTEHLAPETFAPFPKLRALVEAVKSHHRVIAWYAR
jgi:prostaglandin-H2 D-isomerase / glutathione transferase